MPRGISTDPAHFREFLEKSVLLVGGEVIDNNSIDISTETFDGQSWELSVEDFLNAIEGTAAEKFIDVVGSEEIDEDDEEGDD